jgi:hypothetical protein
LSFLIWWPPALVGKHLSFVIEITEQTPRTTRMPTSCARVPHQRLEEDAARGKESHPKCSCACLTPVGTLHVRFRLRASNSSWPPMGIV